MKVNKVLLAILLAMADLGSLATCAEALENFSNHSPFPATSGTVAVSSSCSLRSNGATRLFYRQYNVDTTRFLYVSITNPTNYIGEVYATILINGHAIARNAEGVKTAFAPPHTTTLLLVYTDIVRSGIFPHIDAVSIDCA